MSAIVISDGECITELLKSRGLDENWLKKQLGNNKQKDVFLMTLEKDGSVNIILKEEKS